MRRGGPIFNGHRGRGRNSSSYTPRTVSSSYPPAPQLTSGVSPQNRASTDDGPPEIAEWRKETIAGFASLYLDEETSDVDICVGELKIPAHKAILKLNSQLLTVGEIGHNSETKKMEIELLPEFTELSEVVTDIVKSFYTGKISLDADNVKAVYKFAKSYAVTLLVNHTYPYLEDMLTSKSFPSMFNFAQAVNCSKLTKTCLRKFDNRLAKAMRESDEFLELDYYRIKVLSSSSHVRTNEGKLFKVISKWLDHKPIERGGAAKSLLSNIRYESIGHRNLVDRVYVWIGESQSIDDETRVFLLKASIAGCKRNDSGRVISSDCTRSSSSDTSSD